MKTNPPLIAPFISSSKRLFDEGYDFDVNCEEEAKKRNQRVCYPEPNQLQLDLDSQEASDEMRGRIAALNFGDTEFGEPKARFCPSKTKGHCHVTLTFRKDVVFTDWQRLALQAALGDDPIRSFLNTMRAAAGVKNPTRLFEPKETK